ncbi:efflux RND transporter periplasmic adaptor subunit [Thiomicrolovo sp. ZZH C-3]
MEAMEKVTAYRSPRWKWIILGLVVLIATAVGGYFFLQPAENGQAYRFVTQSAERGELNITVSASGYLQPLESVDVGTEVSGTIEKVLVDYNDLVKKGQLMAQIDKTKYQSTVDKANAALMSAKATLENANAELYRSKATLTRDETLREETKGALPSQSDWDTDYANYLAAKAQVDNAKAQVEQAKHSLVSSQYDLERTAIYSPVDGTVLTREIDPGQTVAASYQTPTLFTIAKDLRKMELQVSVDEADIAKVKAGDTASFTVDAYPDTVFSGTIRMVRVNSEIEDGVVTYIAVLDVNNSDLKLRPGMSADADITVQTFRDALIVPRAALLYLPVATSKETKLFAFHDDDESAYDDKPHVWRLNGQTPEKLYVEVLGTNGTQSVIAGEVLTAGDRLIVAQEKQP